MINYHFDEPFWFIEIRGYFRAFNNYDFFDHIECLGIDAMDNGDFDTLKEYLLMLEALKIGQPLFYDLISKKFEKLKAVFLKNTPTCHAFYFCKNKQ